jgi:putative transposase
MGIARSTYYGTRQVPTDDIAIVEAIAAIARSSAIRRRVRAELRHRGMVANHKKIRRLMREYDLQPRTRRRYVSTSQFPIWRRDGSLRSRPTLGRRHHLDRERRKPPPGCVHHSDRGSQYAAGRYRELLAVHGLTGSMGRRGNPYDNAKAESFMKTLSVCPKKS